MLLRKVWLRVVRNEKLAGLAKKVRTACHTACHTAGPCHTARRVATRHTRRTRRRTAQHGAARRRTAVPTRHGVNTAWHGCDVRRQHVTVLPNAAAQAQARAAFERRKARLEKGEGSGEQGESV